MIERKGADRVFTTRRLSQQAGEASESLGASIIPPSLGSDAFLTSEQDLKKEYPRRWDMYVKTIRANRNNQTIDPEERVQSENFLHTLNNIDTYVRSHQDGDRERTLTGQQFTVFESLQRFLEQGETSGYIKLPTGTGKTVLYAEFVEATGLKTLVVVPKQLLIHQTTRRFEQFAESVEVGKVYSQEKEYGKQVTVTTYESFVNGVRDGNINPDDYGLLILDEAHKSLTSKRKTTVEKFTKAIKLGFTATPNYSTEKRLSQLLNNEIHAMTIREAVESGMLSSFRSIIAETDVDLSDVSISSSGEYDIQELEKVINIEKRNRAAVDLYKKMFMGETGVAYCLGVNHARNLADYFTQQGIAAEVISGKQSSTQQEDILKRYHAGQIKVLCNADILIEGFDEPKATVCLNLRPTLSQVVAEQRGGRVLRLDPDDPEKFAYIVDFVDKTNNRKAYPVTFAQVAQGAYLLNRKFSEGSYSPREPIIRPEIHIEGLTVIMDVEEVMQVVQNMMLQKYTPAPPGWNNRYALSVELERSDTTIKKHAENYRELHPEWFEQYLDVSNRVVEYLAPELVAQISSELGNVTKPEEGWMNANQVAKAIGKSQSVVVNFASGQREEHPEWFRPYIDGMGQTRAHFSPELVALIAAEMSKYVPAPEGWNNNHALARSHSRGDERVKAIAEKYRVEHPDWFKVYLDSSNNPTEYYSPELTAQVNDDLSQYEPAPLGWHHPAGIAEQLGKERYTVIRATQKYRDTNPEWFHTYTLSNGRMSEHYSPQLADAVKNDLTQYTAAPEGWINKNALVKAFNKHPIIIEHFVDKFREKHPEWFKVHSTPSGNLAEHFDPRLAIMTMLELKNYQPAPEGWKNARESTDVLWKNAGANVKRFNKYREAHPDWFCMYTDSGGRLVEHYAPELIELVKHEKEKTLPAPEGWITRSQLTKSLGIHDRVIKRYYELYKEKKPEWFGKYLDARGRENEHSSPEFVDAIKSSIQK